jgi:hypothetical protein
MIGESEGFVNEDFQVLDLSLGGIVVLSIRRGGCDERLVFSSLLVSGR